MRLYKNKNGVNFEIEFEDAPVPEEADYFGFYFIVTTDDGKQDDRVRAHRCLIKKKLCPTNEQARNFALNHGLPFLHSVLETYSDGKTLLLIPASEKWWLI